MSVARQNETLLLPQQGPCVAVKPRLDVHPPAFRGVSTVWHNLATSSSESACDCHQKIRTDCGVQILWRDVNVILLALRRSKAGRLEGGYQGEGSRGHTSSPGPPGSGNIPSLRIRNAILNPGKIRSSALVPMLFLPKNLRPVQFYWDKYSKSSFSNQDFSTAASFHSTKTVFAGGRKNRE